jgi:hypothetical protein
MNAKQRAYLLETYDLEPAILDRLLSDVWAFTQDSPEVWIQKRHAQLQQAGKRNEESYAVIARELAAGRFAAPPLSARQIRRVIYG